MVGKLIGIQMSDRTFKDKSEREVKYTRVYLTFAIRYNQGEGEGYYSKSIITSTSQLDKVGADPRINETYQVYFDENGKIAEFKKVNEK